MQRGEALLLRLPQRPQLGERQALEQFGVGFHLAAEEVTRGDDQHRGVRDGPELEEIGQDGETGRPHRLGHLVQRVPFRPQETIRVGEAGEGAGATGELVEVQIALQQALLARGAEVGQAPLAELGAVRRQACERRRVEEAADRVAQRLVLGAGQPGLDALPPRVAGQRDFEGAPGPGVGLLQGAAQLLAVVGEAVGEELLDGVGRRAPIDADHPAEAPSTRGRRARTETVERTLMAHQGVSCGAAIGVAF